MDLKSLENEALGLSSKERARLAFDLIESLEVLSPAEVEQLWNQEAQRRAEQIDTSSVTLSASEIVSAKARALLR
jgi:hypothetical protein